MRQALRGLENGFERLVTGFVGPETGFQGCEKSVERPEMGLIYAFGILGHSEAGQKRQM